MATSKIRSSTQLNIDAALDAQGNKIINVTDPTNAQDAATKAYVDSNTGLLAGDIISNEVPTGVINGVNATFTLANTPVVGSVKARLNGLGQQEGALNDYTIAGAVITYNAAPLTGDGLLVDYIKA